MEPITQTLGVALGSNGLSRLDTTTLGEQSFGNRSLSIIVAALDEASGTLWVASYTNTITRIDLGEASAPRVPSRF